MQPGHAQPPALSQRVLTAEFCDGCKVNDVDAIKGMGLAAKDVSAVGGVGGERGGHRSGQCVLSAGGRS